MQDTSAPDQPAGTMGAFYAWLRTSTWRRSSSNKWIGGVCSGLGERLGVDPVLWRALALMLLFSSFGLPLFVYLAAWALLPDEHGEIQAQRALHGSGGPIVLLVVLLLSVFLVGGMRDVQWIPFMPLSLVTGVVIWWLLVRNGEVRNPWSSTERGVPPGSVPSPRPVPPVPPPPPPPAGFAVPAVATEPAVAAAPTVAAMPATPAMPAMPATPAVAAMPTVAAAPRRPVPQRPRRRSLGFFPSLMIVGLAVLVGVGARQVHQHYGWSGLSDVVGLAAAVAVLATGLIVIGLLGRRGGFISTLAALTAIATALTLGDQTALTRVNLTELVWTPTAQQSANYRIGVGQATLDLSRFPEDADGTPTITARVSAGFLTVKVPEGQTVRVIGRASVGDITVQPGLGPNVPASTPTADGATFDHTFGSGRPDIIVQSTVGLGELTIQRGTP